MFQCLTGRGLAAGGRWTEVGLEAGLMLVWAWSGGGLGGGCEVGWGRWRSVISPSSAQHPDTSAAGPQRTDSNTNCPQRTAFNATSTHCAVSSS